MRATTRTDNIDLVRMLVERGSDVNNVSDNNKTPLLLAKHASFAELLIEKSADVNHADNGGKTPLIAWAGNEKIVKMLLDRGADPRSHTHEGLTALMAACIDSQDTPEKVAAGVRRVKMLVSKGAEVNAKDSKGETALMMASEFASPEVVAALLSAGADPNVVAKNGSTALSIATGPKLKPMQATDPNNPFQVAAQKKYNEALAQDAAKKTRDPRKERIIELLRKAGARQ